MEYNKQVTLASGNYFAPGTYKAKFRQEFIHGGFATLITTTLLAPIQRWRIIAQTQKAYPLRPKKFTNFANYISRIPKQQGFTAFWRGNTTSLWIYLYQTLFSIGIFDTIKHQNMLVNSQAKDYPIVTSLIDNIFFPLYASVISLSIIHPLDTYRIQKTMLYHKQAQNAHFRKLRHRISQLDSVKQLYQGFWLANIISIINFNFYKNLYDDVKKINLQSQSSSTSSSTSSSQSSNITNIISKQTILSILAVGLVHPLDTFKKIYQLNNMNKPSLFNGYRSVITYIQQHKLQNIFYNGFIASLTRTALYTPIYWQVFNLWQNIIETKHIKPLE